MMSKCMCGLAVVILASSALSANADDFEGFYAGLGIGSAPISAPGADDSATGYKLFTGYSFGTAISDNEVLALELAYIDGGKVQETDNIFPNGRPDGALGGFFKSEVETKIASFSVLGTLPVTEWFGVFAKVGYAYVDLDTTFTNRLFGSVVPLSRLNIRDRESDLTYGGGLALSFGKSFQARAEYEGFDVDHADLSFISLSAIFKFR